MAIIRVNKDPERDKKIDEILPKKPLTETVLFPLLWEITKGVLKDMLLREIEIYKAFPKSNGKYDPETFNPRNNKTCFLGLGFFRNGQDGWQDEDVILYRKRVGVLAHPVWGKGVTLLEIWGGDHHEKWPEMVKGVYTYAYGEGVLPEITFHVNPLIFGPESGTYLPDEEDLAEQRSAKLARENEIRRQWKLPPQDYLAEEIEAYEKAENWSKEYGCPLDEVPEARKRRDRESKLWQRSRDLEDDED